MSNISRLARLGLAIGLLAPLAGRAAEPAPWELDRSYAQTSPIPVPAVPEAERLHNEQVVIDFYYKVAHVKDWSEANLLKYFDANFVQHDPSEPSTVHDYAHFLGSMKRPVGPDGKPAKTTVMPGHHALDANGYPVNATFSDGPYVFVVRQRNWAWTGGPETVFNSVFVDIWRLKNGKITDQWCSCTPADANLPHIAEAKAAGLWTK